jgi:hypothetical protein
MVEGDELEEHERVQLAEQMVQEHDALALRIQPPRLDALFAQGRVVRAISAIVAIVAIRGVMVMGAMLAGDVCSGGGGVVGRVWAGHGAAALASPRGLGLVVHCAARQRNARQLRACRRDKEELPTSALEGAGHG